MDESFGSRLKHAWNAFMNRSPTYRTADYGASYSYRPDRPRLTRGNERSIVFTTELPWMSRLFPFSM